MAEAKKSFPMLPVAHWFALRRKFKQSIPGVVTNNYLSTVLDMGADSARANVLPFLKVLGIIDEEGKPKDRAKQWRDDGHYPDVCKAILKEVYPPDLLDAVANPRDDREMAKRWFANHTGSGDGACGRMAALYTVLVDANPNSDAENSRQKSVPKPAKASKPSHRVAPSKEAKPPAPQAAPATTKANHDAPPNVPAININLQVHISADSSSDQIEQIFAAMAKHIYKRP